VEDVQAAVEKNPALAFRLLKLANSPYFGMHGKAGSIREAIMFLGFKPIRGFCLSVGVFDAILEHLKSPAIDSSAVWRHAIATAGAAKEIAELKGYEDPAICFAAGLLHDIGKLILMTLFRDKYADVVKKQSRGISSVSCEEDILNVTHCQTGAWLCRHWGLPNSLLYPALHHHGAEDSPVSYQQCVFAVQAADALANAVMNVPHDATIPEAVLNFTGLTNDERQHTKDIISAEDMQEFLGAFLARPE
jgi:putative nucleotidyltransferase with HDIG domain